MCNSGRKKNDFNITELEIFRSTPSLTQYNISVLMNCSKVNSESNMITLEQVSWHNNAMDCWIVIYDRVYNVTHFLYEHPGGSDILLEHAGRDASYAFRGTGHSSTAIQTLNKYQVGDLPLAERIFRKPGGFTLSDMPE